MQVKKQVIDDTEDEYVSQKLERKLAFLNKVRSGNRPYPKRPHQLISVREILGDLELSFKSISRSSGSSRLEPQGRNDPSFVKSFG